MCYNFSRAMCTSTFIFQGISYLTIATDGISSYAIFTYRCGELRRYSGDTVIGFSAGSDFYANFNYSSSEGVADIDCLSADWTSMVYYIGGGMLD